MNYALGLKKNDVPTGQPSKIESLMQLAGEASPALAHSLKTFRECSVGSFLSQIQMNANDAYQSCDDLLTYIEGYVSRTLDPETAARAVNDIRKHPMILTANHHGVDYFSQL